MLLMAAVYAAFPEDRNWPLVAAMAGVGLCFRLISSGRVYQPAVTRTGDKITCRFNPWREATFYFVLIWLPLFGVMALAGSGTLDRFSPGFWQILGVLLIAATPIFVFIFMRQSRQSLLSIGPEALGSAAGTDIGRRLETGFRRRLQMLGDPPSASALDLDPLRLPRVRFVLPWGLGNHLFRRVESIR
ncbi:hypothetical protein [Mycolicibacterium sp.]|uniref:hypothetical protein n=1 Tax=Mycolicibacterium sp. TaxID=2320850 RepID=UPI0028A78084|nr:hypothetical protein [Mycolicibacterium sp.]